MTLLAATLDHAAVDLRTLIGHNLAIPAAMAVEAVQAEFARTNVDFLAVLDGATLLGVCARRELVQALGTRYGFSLNARQPVHGLLLAAPLRVPVGAPVTDVFRAAAGRSDREFFDDVLLVDDRGGYLGLIPMRSLARLQTEFLLNNIAHLEESRREIAAKNHEMEADLLMAREVQLAMLPSLQAPPDTAGRNLRLAHRFHPAGGVSGDFFNVLRLDGDCTGILVGDVMGHGVRSALITAMVRAIVEELRPCAADPGGFLTRLNRDLTSILRQTGTLIFVTAAYLVIDPGSGRLRYAQAGHPTPLRGNCDGCVTRSLTVTGETAGPALGLVEDFGFVTTEESFAPGEHVVLFTDGVTEAPAPSGEEFGPARLAASLARNPGQSLESLLATVVANVTQFCASTALPDDVCLVAAALD